MYFLICHAHVEKDIKPFLTFPYCKCQKDGSGPRNEVNERWQFTHFLWQQLDIWIIIHVIYMYVFWPIEGIANARAQESIKWWSLCLQHPVCNILSCGLLYIARLTVASSRPSNFPSSGLQWLADMPIFQLNIYWCFQTQSKGRMSALVRLITLPGCIIGVKTE